MGTESKKKFTLKDLEAKLGGMTMGKFLRSWRLCEDMSQKEFARLIGLSAANLCDLEKGRKGISPERAYAIAKRIGYSPSVLVSLALEEQLEKVGLKYKIELKSAA